MTDINTEVEQARLLEDIVDIDPTEHPDLMAKIDLLREGKARVDSLESDNKRLRDDIVAYMRDELHAAKVSVDGKVEASLTSPEQTKINWALLERLAPKAVERSRYKEAHDRLTLGRIKRS